MIGRMTLRESGRRWRLPKRGGRRRRRRPLEIGVVGALLEQEADAGVPAAESRQEGAAEQGSATDDGGQRGSRHSPPPRSPRRRGA